MNNLIQNNKPFVSYDDMFTQARPDLSNQVIRVGGYVHNQVLHSNGNSIL